jgi:hypothetical protein
MVWLAIVLVTAVVVAVLRGGRLTNLSDIRLTLWWLLPIGFAMQWATGLLPDRSWSEAAGVAMILASYLPLLVVVIANRNRPGMWLAGLGVLMNFTVIALNGGMPVLSEAAAIAAGDASAQLDLAGNYKHVVLGDSTLLPFLGDVIPVRIFTIGQVVSMGDVFLAVGLGRFLEAELRRPVRWFRPGVKLRAGSADRR